MLNDPLANAFSNIQNMERIASKECMITPSSKLIKACLNILKDREYIGDYEETMNNKGNLLKVNLLGRINKCGVIKPRHAIEKEGYEKFEKRFLPARNFGILIVSTSQGLMTHEDAKKKNIGGRLIAYCY